MATQFQSAGANPAGFTRRGFLISAGLGALAVGGIGALSGCTPAASGGSGSASGAMTGTFGATETGVGKDAVEAVVADYQQRSGNTLTLVNYVNEDFRANINNYLQGSPEDAFQWSAGYRTRYYANKGLLAPMDDVWESVAGNYSEGMANASTGEDGKKYLVPTFNYPWGYYYRKSVWADRGYEVPETFDAFVDLCKTMKADGMIPIAFGDKEGWPAQGTFDYFNMRTNGYQFHIDLCAHNEPWNQKKVQDVFDNWKEVLPFQDSAALGQTWEDATDTIAAGKSGMQLMGGFLTNRITDPDILADIDFFPFPEVAVEGREAIEAPIDGIVLSKRGGESEVAKDFLKYMGTTDAQNIFGEIYPAVHMAVKGVDQSAYTDLKKKEAATIGAAKNISQFFDRDALPAMANNVLVPALQGFLKDGTIDLDSLESQAVTLYAAE